MVSICLNTVLPPRPKWERTDQTIQKMGGWSVSTSLMNLLACPRWSGPSHQIDSEHPSVLPTSKCIDHNQLTRPEWWNPVTLAVEPFVAVFSYESAMFWPSHGIFFISIERLASSWHTGRWVWWSHTHAKNVIYYRFFTCAHQDRRRTAIMCNRRQRKRHRRERRIWPLALHRDDLCLPTWRKKRTVR